MKDESAQRFKDLQEEFSLYEAARKDPKQASEQVAHIAKSIVSRTAVARRLCLLFFRHDEGGLTLCSPCTNVRGLSSALFFA